MSRVDWYLSAVRSLGMLSLARRQLQKTFRSAPYTLTAKRLRHPVYVRPGTSDLLVFDQIFVEREYRCLDGIQDVQLIIDCGANVGYSSVQFLSRWPGCHVVAIEPDPDNYAILTKNLSPYPDRYNAFAAAVWPHAQRLSFTRPLALGGEWGRSVRPARNGEGHIKTMTMPELIVAGGAKRVSILKIDIEGAERELFSGDTRWLDQVDNIVIELHGEDCDTAFFSAIEQRKFGISRCGELTVCLSGRDR